MFFLEGGGAKGWIINDQANHMIRRITINVADTVLSFVHVQLRVQGVQYIAYMYVLVFFFFYFLYFPSQQLMRFGIKSIRARIT